MTFGTTHSVQVYDAFTRLAMQSTSAGYSTNETTRGALFSLYESVQCLLPHSPVPVSTVENVENVETVEKVDNVETVAGETVDKIDDEREEFASANTSSSHRRFFTLEKSGSGRVDEILLLALISLFKNFPMRRKVLLRIDKLIIASVVSAAISKIANKVVCFVILY